MRSAEWSHSTWMFEAASAGPGGAIFSSGYVVSAARRRLLILILPLIFICLPGFAADSLTWRANKDSVDADIASWTLLRTLETIAEATGWQVYVEPGTQRIVSTKFKDRSKDRALDFLLGDLGRALLPGTNGGPPRLLVFRDNQKNATRLIRAPRKGPKPIPNELIIRAKSGKNLDDLAKKLGAKIVARNKDLNSARLQFQDEDTTQKARESLLNNDDVASVDPNFPIVDQPVPENGPSPALPDLKLAPLKDGEGIVIGLIDTTVQRQGNGKDGFILPSVNVAGENSPDPDRPTHGTLMEGALANGIGLFANCEGGTRVRVLPVDVYGPNATTTTYEVATGIHTALQQGASIINLSLGSEGDTPYLHDIIKQGAAAGRVFIASAGNTPVTTPTYPAAYPEVLAVTAGDSKGNLASYANRGAFVDVMAPGNAFANFNGQTWRVSGTSPAAAYISGAIAGQSDCNGLSLQQALSAIRTSMPAPPLAP